MPAEVTRAPTPIVPIALAEVAVTWPICQNEHGGHMLWYGSWLVGQDGAEGRGFYSGRGGTVASYPVPAGAIGLRVRRWPNEGLDPEYADVLAPAVPARVAAGDLPFDDRQHFSLLAGLADPG